MAERDNFLKSVDEVNYKSVRNKVNDVIEKANTDYCSALIENNKGQ